MKIAVLIMGFAEPNCLRVAIPIYKAAGFDLFLHLDGKASADEYLAKLGHSSTYVNLLQTRCHIFWGGFSMIEAELALLHAAKITEDYDKYMLLSDDTFPLLPPEDLRRSLARDEENIMLRKLGENDPFYKRYSNFFWFDHPAMSLHGRPIESSAIDAALITRLEEVKLLMKSGKRQIDIYYGSQWWCLTRHTINMIQKTLEDDLLLRRSFEYSAVPDEICLQTLVGNLCTHDRIRSGHVHVDWSRNPRPFVFTNAAQITTEMRDSALFVRKVSSQNPAFLEEMFRNLMR